MNKYSYPKGDFLSGFSEDESTPCDYELECQRMVIRGVMYLEENRSTFDYINKGGVSAFDPNLKQLIDYMIEPESGQTGAMVSHAVNHCFHATKIGWDEYIKKLTSK
jgi:hypothetical protein